MKLIAISVLFLSLLLSCKTIQNTLLEEPKYKSSNGEYIKHYAYSLLYNEEYEQAHWVAYQLTSEELTPNFKRTDKFISDTAVVSGSASDQDYKGSGFDRGHLAPAADMVWSKQAMDESFYYSNICPQLAGFNRGIWKELEVQVRDWAREYGSVYITTGSICTASSQTIGENQVSVPTGFYKTILVYNDSLQGGIGFVFPHEKCEGELADYAVSIDSVESLTGLNLYSELPNKIEKRIENSPSLWLFIK